MKKSTWLCGFIFLGAGITVSLAGAEIHGWVKDIYNRPLVGIHIRIGESGRFVVSDEKGEFNFTVDESATVLQLYFESPQFHLEKKTLSLADVPVNLKIYLIPIRLLKEDVTVTALNQTEKAIAIPFAQNVVSQVAIRESLPETVVQAVQNSPGVHFIGKGGVAVTPSIRGLARRRVLLLVDGARITSDRSAGAAAQFIPPEFIQQIEIVRSAASVIYGSDAIGGVLQIIARDTGNFESRLGTLNVSGNSANQKANGGLLLSRKFGDLGILAAVQMSQAEDYASAQEKILNSGYHYYTGNLVAQYETENRSIKLNFLKSAGRNIGKPERANDPAISSFYPQENVNLLNVSYRENRLVANGSLNFSFFLNPNDHELNKIKYASEQIEISKNSALDFGFRATLKKSASAHLAYQIGVDCFGRNRVNMANETWKNGKLSSASQPVWNGRRNDLGMYFTLDYSGLPFFDLVAGARLGAFSRSALSDGEFLKKKSMAPAFFLGITKRFQDSMTFFFNAGTAYRLPSLSEAFYTGITGRSSIVGNPALKPETSLNLDAGVKIHRKNIFLGAYLFQSSIRDMIEKFPLRDAVYTYANIERGRIRGLELEFQFYPWKKLELFGNGFYYKGVSSASGAYLNDIPSPRLLLGAKLWLGRFWGEVNWMTAAAVTHPGPAEAANPSYTVTDFKTGYYFSNRLFLFAKIANLFNRSYYANADPDIPQAKGLDLSVGLNLNL